MAVDTTGSVWAIGDYPRVAREVLAGLGPQLVRASELRPGQRVLDAAAGSGVVAIPAALAGAEVVAADLTPELLAAGRAEAESRGLAIEWVEADVQALPFPDADFDAVLSSVGAIFAADHRRTADELLRVCRPGGTIAMANWTPEGSIGDFFRLFAGYAVPAATPLADPVAAPPPTAWGTEPHVRALFGDRIESLWTEQRSLVVDRFANPYEYRAFYRAAFGPVVATYAALAGDPDRQAALDRDFLDYAMTANRAAAGEPARYEYEYLLVVARKRR